MSFRISIFKTNLTKSHYDAQSFSDISAFTKNKKAMNGLGREISDSALRGLLFHYKYSIKFLSDHG